MNKWMNEFRNKFFLYFKHVCHRLPEDEEYILCRILSFYYYHDYWQFSLEIYFKVFSHINNLKFSPCLKYSDTIMLFSSHSHTEQHWFPSQHSRQNILFLWRSIFVVYHLFQKLTLHIHILPPLGRVLEVKIYVSVFGQLVSGFW